MSVSTTSELVLLNLRCASAINDIFAFNKKWEYRFTDHQQEVYELVGSSHGHYLDLLRCLTELGTLCTQSRFMLDTMKMELTIAIENRSYDQVNIFELRALSRQLKVGLEILVMRLKQFGKDITVYGKDMDKERRRINRQPCSISLVGTIVNSACAAITTGCLVSDRFHDKTEETNKDRLEIPLAISAGGFSLTAAAACHVMQAQKQKKKDGLVHVLDKVDTRMRAVFHAVDEFAHDLKSPMLYIDRQIKLSEENIAYYVHPNPARVFYQANLMLENSVKLDTMFQDIQEKAVEHSNLLRNAIRIMHPRSLLYL
ncbi:uncharacterized protein EV154DRAFT_564933 [Mucor mucedo]|uniref:uncharacterized protein n=1 Tax=Mucor mucedo TaxID=29922 RepID=UPI0022202832|nr:uncharacterized protein EV154DRAFT_564933 [Mucor mucedo]KAI7889857.1 hypothetical protein EV154DRAFT_564933 [Mucor mucedo]